MRILHTEASPGWGGQEIRILKEAIGMRKRGHELFFVVQKGGGLVSPLLQAGFKVLELNFTKSRLPFICAALLRFVLVHKIDLINTHSSLDSWLGGIVGRLTGRRVVRTRHLSTPIRGGINRALLYDLLPHKVVTTCQEVAVHLSKGRSIPTGVDPQEMAIDEKEVRLWKERWGVGPGDLVVGTLCVLRGWKGVSDLLQSAKILEGERRIKWVVIGGGVSEEHFLQERKRLELDEKVYFTGHLTPPFSALHALDVFVLLSHAHEGVSQASLQAAWLKKALITTETGGLKEVCIPDQTGFIVPLKSPQVVAKRVKLFLDEPKRVKSMGEAAHTLVRDHFMWEKTLDEMESLFKELVDR